jgi:hypothetical protein
MILSIGGHMFNGYPVWDVVNKKSQLYLGTVIWWEDWQQYVFEPMSDTIHSSTCLIDLARFCDLMTEQVPASDYDDLLKLVGR